MSRLLTRRGRRPEGITWKLHNPEFVSRYPWIPATGPEQMVFEELVDRHIFFHFQIPLIEAVPLARGLPVLNQKPYRADFLIPSLKIVLDPWDDYHHSLGNQPADDAEKLSVYRALGFKTYHVWASELFKNGVEWWFHQIPGLDATRRGGFKLHDVQDDSAGIAAGNRARAQHTAPDLRTRRRRGRRAA